MAGFLQPSLAACGLLFGNGDAVQKTVARRWSDRGSNLFRPRFPLTVRGCGAGSRVDRARRVRRAWRVLANSWRTGAASDGRRRGSTADPVVQVDVTRLVGRLRRRAAEPERRQHRLCAVAGVKAPVRLPRRARRCTRRASLRPHMLTWQQGHGAKPLVPPTGSGPGRRAQRYIDHSA